MRGAGIAGSFLTLFRRSLRAKFIGVIVVLQLSLMVLVTLVIGQRQRSTILAESRTRAFSLASNLTALSEGDLLSYNYIRLKQTVAQIAAEADVAYAIVHLHDGRVAASSVPRMPQGTTLHDPVSQQAIAATTPLVQEVSTPELAGPGYDVAVPFFAPGSARQWGTIRVGFSLARARRVMQETTRDLWLLSALAILLGTAVAVFLARCIARPVRQLVRGVNEVAQGHYQHAITVTAQDEIGHLAQRFEEMRQALCAYITHLAEEKRHLEEANDQLKAAQAQLIQSEKLAVVGKMAAKVAHEVNNPLAIIKTSLDIARKRLPGGHGTREDLAMVEEEIERIARIMRQLLDFSRPASDVSVLRVNEVIQHLLKFTAGDLAARQITSQLEFAKDLPMTHMSFDQLEQVLLNLIKNAQDAMPHGGTLRITTTRQPGGLVISVADTGVGIPPAHLPLLFQPFFTTKKLGQGWGLGLSVSANIIKSYGGAIDVESTPGKGSALHIFLPAYPRSRGEDSTPDSRESTVKEEREHDREHPYH